MEAVQCGVRAVWRLCSSVEVTQCGGCTVCAAGSLARLSPRTPPSSRPPTLQADLDLGNYERFLGVTLTKDHNITTGKVYSQVIHAERRGDYLGKTVQVIPHVTDAIQDWIDRGACGVWVGWGGVGWVHACGRQELFPMWLQAGLDLV